jgi:hypothetical protein
MHVSYCPTCGKTANLDAEVWASEHGHEAATCGSCGSDLVAVYSENPDGESHWMFEPAPEPAETAGTTGADVSPYGQE